jgi:DNA invertase Pin-like site-specific DNA recombinase
MTKATTTPKTLDAVIRVSRRNGREGDSFLSPTEQREAIERWRKTHNATIAAWHDETDSVSGGSVEREGLQAALARAEAGETDGIIVAKIDRFARTVPGGLSVIAKLEDAGKNLITVREGVIVGDEKASATDKFVRLFWLGLAAWQRDTLMEGWASVRERKIAAGVHLAVPFGFERSDGQGSKLTPVEPFAGYVREVFAKRAAGTSWPRIAAWLNTKCKTPDGHRWTHKTVRDLAHTWAYLGWAYSGIDKDGNATPDGFVNREAHDAIVTRELWDRAHARAGRRHAQPEDGYLLSGLARCSSCGYKLRHDPVGKHRYYRCAKNHGGGVCPAPVSVPAGELEDVITERFHDDFGGLRVQAARLGADVADAVAVVEAAAAGYEAVVEAMPANLTGRAADVWRSRERRALAELQAAEATLGAARSHAVGADLPDGDLSVVWANATVPQRRDLLERVYGVVVVRRGIGYREPVIRRARVIGRPDTPADLPGRGNVGLRPLPFVEEHEAGMPALQEVA